jgi:hypothetical protein
MTVAAKRSAELREEAAQLMQSQRQGWEQFANSQ